jgi:hypothetical protein
MTASKPRSLQSIILFGGLITLALYLLLFILLQSHTLWESPTLLQDRWFALFYALRDLFPSEWIWASRQSQLGLLNVALYLALVALLFTTYLSVARRFFQWSLVNVQQTLGLFRLIFLFTGVSLLVLFLVPGTFSTDLYSYVWYGKIYALYADNPLLHVPAEYAWYDTQGWLQWVYWKDVPSAYGPGWLVLAGGIAQIARVLDNDIVTHLLGHKLVASGAHLLNVWLVWRLAGYVVIRFWARDGRPLDELAAISARLGVTLLYAWNPLLLIEFGASGHNDVLMLTCLLAGLLLCVRGHPLIASVLLALACLIKAFALVFLPGYLWLLLWQGSIGPESDVGRKIGQSLGARLSLAAKSLGLIIVTWTVAYLPFWAGPSSLEALSGGPAARYFIHSLGAVLRFRLPEGAADVAALLGWQPSGNWTVDEIGRRLEWPARWGPVAITYTVFVFQTVFARSFARMVVGWCWVLITYLTIGAVWFWPWYVSWLIVPAVLVGPGRILTATHILSITSLSLYAIYPTVARPFDKLSDWTGLWITGPPLAYLAISYILEKRKK